MFFGIIAPLFAIHSRSSCYRGDFADLTKMIEITSSIGGNYLQLLPIQDTGGIDSPYSLSSWFAIDIRYLHIEELSTSNPLSLQEQIALKRATMKSIYEKKKDDLGFQKQIAYFRKDHTWVLPYACFKVLKEKFNHLPWWQWEKPYQTSTPELLRSLESSYYDEVQLEIWIQMRCFEQLSVASQRARHLKITLCCDLPHFCDRDSAEGWSNSSLFLSHSTAGAPPDDYAPEGQNWNVAPWDWEHNEIQVFQIWQDRNTLFASYFTYARIDHAVGLFRQWIIAEGEESKNGIFCPSKLEDALKLGKNTLIRLDHSSLQLIAENLGTIPPEVNQILADLHILGTIVWRWNRYWNDPGAPFIPIQKMEGHNLLSLTTHDSSSIEGWARKEPKDFALFCKTYNLPFSPKPSLNATQVDPSLRLEILSKLQSAPCVLKAESIEEFLLLEEGFGDPNPEKQRINDPAYPKNNNWTYRCKVDIDTLAQSSSWKEKMEKIIACNKT